MHFEQLPSVLQDMVCDFAWKTTWNGIRLNLEQLFLIKEYKLPPIFLRQMIFVVEYGGYVPTPLDIYRPIFDLSILFNQHRIHELLYKLDFRKRTVKCMGSRWKWIHAMEKSHENILQFSIFYRMLLGSQGIWTPTYQHQLDFGFGADHLI